MRAYTSADYADLFFEHLSALRRYAERVFIEGDTLNRKEDSDRLYRVREFFEVGKKCEFTEQQLVRLLYAELFE